MSTVIGVDLGGTKIALGRFDAITWELQEESRMETHAHKSFSHVYQDMLLQIASLRQADTIAIGIGVPGLVHQPDGVIVTMPNIPGGEGFALKKNLEHDTNLPVDADNDANCFALAEAVEGTGKGHSVFVGVSMGTGVGGGIVIDGKIFRGAHGFAAEIGHMLLKPGEPPFPTNNKRGEVEQFLSGTAFGKRCDAAKKPEEYMEGEVCEFMRPDVFKEVAWMCTSITHLLDPTMIAFGGSAGRALKPHLHQIKASLEEWALPGTPLPELAIAELPHAAILGAALLTRSSKDS